MESTLKITTIIPAYKPKYIFELLTSLNQQTLPSNRILISDDSPNGEFRCELYSERMKPLLVNLNIDFVEGPRKGSFENIIQLLQLWGGSSDLVHLMMDDDVIYPEFYERHLIAHTSANLSCSISRRWTANELGVPMTDLRIPDIVRYNPNRMLALDSDFVFLSAIGECLNWFGEFSNTVMRANTCDILNKTELGGISYKGLDDLGYFLTASLRAPIGYIQDHLGYFRTGAGCFNNSSDPLGLPMRMLMPAQAALVLGGYRVDKLTLEQKLNCYKIITRGLNPAHSQLEDMRVFYQLLPQMAASVPDAEDRFLDAWAAFLKNAR